MRSTMALMERALKVHTASEWNRLLGLSKNAISEAKRAGRLTPVVAGHFAIELDEDPAPWMALAVLEGEKPSPAKEMLVKRVAKAGRIL